MLLAGSLLAACSGSPAPGSSTQGGSSSGSNPSSSSGSGSAPSTAKKTLVVGAATDIRGWDIHNHNNVHTEAVHQHVFDYLVYYNFDTASFDPGLATEWKLVEPTVWEFKLREGVKFSNGEPFDATDVKYTLERVSRDQSLREYGSNRTIKEVQIVDDHTVRIVTHDPDPLLLNRLSRIGSGMLPADYINQVGMEEFMKNPVGTGAFILKEWVRDDHVTLVANPDHWRGAPSIDELVFRVLPEEATRIAEIQTGGIDIALSITADARPALQNDPNVKLQEMWGSRVYLMEISFQDGAKTQDPRVREAIERAIDKDALIAAVEGGAGIPTRTRLIPGLVGHTPKYYNTNELYDPEKAKALLAEAGYPNGIEIGMVAPSSGNYPLVAQTIQGMLEAVGFKVNLEILDTTTFNNRMDAHEVPELLLIANSNSMKDPDLVFVDMLPGQSSGEYENPKVTELVNAGAQEMDPAKRQKIYEELMDVVAEDRPRIYLYHVASVHGVANGVDWAPRKDDMYWFHNVSITE